jgi:hypothetical protein
MSGGIGYYSKESDGGFYDSHDQEVLVTNQSDKSMHLTTLLQTKVEAVIGKHSFEYPGVGAAWIAHADGAEEVDGFEVFDAIARNTAFHVTRSFITTALKPVAGRCK